MSPRVSLCLSAAAFFLYVGIVRSRYALFFYYVQCHPLMTHGRTVTNRRRTCIGSDILDDDSLLNIFYHCRPPVPLEGGDRDTMGLWDGGWECEYWWYKLAWVCRRWRRLILASPSYLGLSLVCRSGTPVADMLEHSPPFPLIIDHIHAPHDITAEDEEGILLALKNHDRVRRIRLRMSVLSLDRLIAALDDVFPMLEYLDIGPQFAPNWNGSLFPSTLRAPHLRHLVLFDISLPIGPPLLAGLVTLSLQYTHPSANFGSGELLDQLKFMLQLETLRITIYSPLSDQDIEEQLLQIPLSTHVTLPNVRWFEFNGPLASMRSVLPRITMPSLKIAEIIPTTFPDFAFSTYFVLQFVCKTENPRFGGVRVTFHDQCVVVTMYPHEWTDIPTLRMRDSWGGPVDGLVSTERRLCAMGPVFSEVELLTLEDETSLEWHKGSSMRADWHDLLGLFNKVRILHVAGGDLIEGLSCSLLPEDHGSSIEGLPDLRVLSCPKGSRVGKSCRSLIAVRRNAGHPVTLARH